MKKLLTVFLTLCILFASVIAIDTFATTTDITEPVSTPTDEPVNPPTDEPAVPEKLLAPEFSAKIRSEKKFSADYILTQADGTEMTGRINGIGPNVCMDMTMSSITISILQTEEKAYFYFPKFPFFYITMKNPFSPLSVYNWPASDLIEAYYDDSGYQVEKYNCYGDTYIYYFDGNELLSLEVFLESGEH